MAGANPASANPALTRAYRRIVFLAAPCTMVAVSRRRISIHPRCRTTGLQVAHNGHRPPEPLPFESAGRGQVPDEDSAP
jgi:hypothetical protein